MRFPFLSTLTLSLAATVLADVAPRPTPAAMARRQEASPVTELNIGGSLVPVAVVTRSGTPVTVTVEPSPTGIPNCVLHGDHWDCPLADGSVDHSGHDHGDDHSGHDHSGHSHAGHSHGPSEEYGCGLAPYTDQSIRLQIVAVFVLLIAASLGAGLPNILRRKPEPSDAPTSVLGQLFFLLKHFGTGIILSTAFVHLLFHAFIFMSNECIGTLVYEAASPAIAMGAVWLVFVVDFFVLRALRQRAAAAAAASRPLSQGSHDPESKLQSDSESASSDVASQDVPTAAQAKLRKYDVLMLEAGIIFHSIIIGVTLGASNGEGWVPLFIAITFHQLFEGLALGARIALLPSTTAGWLQKTIMCGAYAVTTPVGIAIGIGARRSFNTNDRSTLLALGILDSISAGILLYTALVELIAGDFINNKTMSGAPLGRAIAAVTALTLGAAAMSVLALWA